MKLRISVLADDRVVKARFLGEHGFCAHIEADGHRILFDTGQGMAFRRNAEILGIDLGAVDTVALSHGHYDHADGVPSLLSLRGFRPVVYLHPAFFSRRFEKEASGGMRDIGFSWTAETLSRKGIKVRQTAAPSFVCDSAAVSGEIPRDNDHGGRDDAFLKEKDGGFSRDDFSDDQALYIKTKDGIIVITGCAHAGIVNTVKYGLSLMRAERVFAIIGGTHLSDAEPGRIEKTVRALKDIGVKKVCAGHCTGIAAACAFRAAFGNSFEMISAGWEFFYDG